MEWTIGLVFPLLVAGPFCEHDSRLLPDVLALNASSRLHCARHPIHSIPRVWLHKLCDRVGSDLLAHCDLAPRLSTDNCCLLSPYVRRRCFALIQNQHHSSQSDPYLLSPLSRCERVLANQRLSVAGQLFPHLSPRQHRYCPYTSSERHKSHSCSRGLWRTLAILPGMEEPSQQLGSGRNSLRRVTSLWL